uniref:Lipoprotein n=1 Tax=Schlesneria paludicola TaxID=360056 RepID=A0A7C2JYF3_9PLAN
MNRRIWSWLLAGGAACGLIGCGGPSQEFKPAAELPAAHDDHGHVHGESAEGPHHGALVELGEEEFHAEIVVDGKAHSLKLYLLGPDAKTAASTAASEATIAVEDGPTLTLKAVEGQPEGMNTVFEVVDEKAVHDIAEAEFIHGELKITVGEKEFKTGLDVHFHADHDHEHEAKPTEPAPAEPEGAAKPE